MISQYIPQPSSAVYTYIHNTRLHCKQTQIFLINLHTQKHTASVGQTTGLWCALSA